MQYILKTPQSFAPDKKYPLIVYLHGAGSRGNTTDVLQNAVIFKYTEREKAFPAIILAPLCSADTWFDVFEQLLSLVDTVSKLPFVDQNRVSLTGVSMGGYAAYQLLMSRSGMFSAAVICCGGGMYWNAEKLTGVPVHIYHGAKDDTVYPDESQKMANAINRRGGRAALTIFPDLGHNCWENVYNDEKVYRFLLSGGEC